MWEDTPESTNQSEVLCGVTTTLLREAINA
jgi:hypothetical protein